MNIPVAEIAGVERSGGEETKTISRLDNIPTAKGGKSVRRYILFACLCLMLAGHGLAQTEETGDVDAFRQMLEQDNFSVQEGEIGYFDLIKLYDSGVMPSAYGNNPATKYLAYFVPPAPGYPVDERIAEIAKTLGMSGNTSSFWNLGPDEAVVFVGQTPPECRYFGYDNYLMSRTYGNETRWIFANIGDSLNNQVINTNGGSGDPYNQTTMIVATADRGIDERVRAAARSAGYSDDMMNTQVFPSSVLNMGLDNTSDTFGIFIRPALFTDKQAGDEYINNTPATILRVTPKNTTTLEPYESPDLRVRGTGKTELDLTDDLNDLRDAILEKHGNLSATELPTSVGFPMGNDAIQRGIDAVGPSNDAAYLWSANQTVNSPTPPFFDTTQYYDFLRNPPITLGNNTNEFIIVYGVNHVATGKATYSSFSLYGADVWNGVGSITDADFSGTAEEYLPDNPDAKYLYVYKIARDCEGDLNCFEVPSGIGSYGIEPDQPIFIIWRSYLESATKTGPSYNEMVYDRAIKFEPGG